MSNASQSGEISLSLATEKHVLQLATESRFSRWIFIVRYNAMPIPTISWGHFSKMADWNVVANVAMAIDSHQRATAAHTATFSDTSSPNKQICGKKKKEAFSTRLRPRPITCSPKLSHSHTTSRKSPFFLSVFFIER